MKHSNSITIKRIYDTPSDGDGCRILVDRLWPRGISKKAASIEIWLKQLAPSSRLRIWFQHDPARFDEFRIRYLEELSTQRELANATLSRLTGQRITLLYAAKNETINHAVVLRDFLLSLRS